MKTQDGRSLSADAQEALRRRAVAAVRERGMSKAEVVRTFGVSKTALFGWLKQVKAGGERRLAARKRGRPPESKLRGHQAATIVRLITNRNPDQLRLPFALWTREAVAELIEARFGIQFSVWTVGRLLRRWGFTPQKPLRRAYERNPAEVQRWLKEAYPAIRARAKAENAEIHWGDEMGLRSDHQTGTSYSPKGKTPVVAGTGRRFGCNMISTVTNRGQLAFMVFKERFTAKVFLRFLRRLIRHRDRKVFLIVDGHPVHRSKAVVQWLARHGDRLRLYRLPSYSPDLNPDELLNNDVKSNALGRQRPKTRDEMIESVRRYLRDTQCRPTIVRNYFQHPTVAYAAE